MTVYKYNTHEHIGDNVICTGAVRNVRLAHPEIRFAMPSANPELCMGNPDYEHDCTLWRETGKITYGTLEDEQHGRWGNVVEGFTRSLCAILNLPLVPIRVRHPILVLDDSERLWASQWEDCIMLNANCQKCSKSKGYPHWQEVVDMLDGHRIIQVGGNENRDISPNLRGVEDMRGRTTIRQLMAMVYGCRAVVSPPSCISNIAGAFSRRQVILNAGREPDVLLYYENAVHVSHRCECGWGVETGCISCRFDSTRRGCPRPRRVDGIDYVQCQCETRPEDVISALSRLNAI